MNALQRFSDGIDKMNEYIGRGVSWCTFILMILICVDVIRRLLFNQTAAWILEAEWHLFALVFLLGGGYTFLHDRHVRVDVFYSKMSARDQAWVNALGIVLLLLPWCTVLIYWGSVYAWQSYQIGEGSPNPNGLTAWWPIKFAIPVGFLFLWLQALSALAKQIIILRNPKPQKS